MSSPVSRGFRHLRRPAPGEEGRVPPGQYVTQDFPVLSAGPTPHTPLPEWTFSIRQGGKTLKSWTWQEFRVLAAETVTVDIHCVTRWSKLDTVWRGVSVDTLLDQVTRDAPYVLAFCDGGYTANLPVKDVTGGQAWVAFDYDGRPLESEYGGPARLLVPHLYFWKSAKWVRGLDQYRDGAQVMYTLTRSQPPGWTGYSGRVDAAMLAEIAWPAGQHPLAFVCGPTRFAETVAGKLVALGYPAGRVKTERFGGT
jgi:DMSO/TMAO reductase YedYZ molybdopterin-dependent catalytic subunit